MSNKKFRVWDKLEKRFIFSNQNYQGHFILSLDAKFTNLQNGSGGEEYIVQQFTGKLDSKGEEIYEGDIVYYCVRPFEHGEVEEYQGEVFWDSEAAAFLIDRDMQYCWFDCVLLENTIKVIGNIFESN